MPIINLSNLPQFTAVNLNSDQGAIPGPVQVPQCAQVVFNWTLPDGHLAHNVLYGRYAGGFAGSQAQCNAILTALVGSAQFSALQPFLHTGTIFSGVSLRDVNTINQALITSSSAGPAGTGTGNPVPSEVAAVITLRTALVGRANRGRVFIPGWATAALGPGDTIIAAALTALTNWAGTISGALSASSYTWVIGQKARAAYTGSTGAAHPARAATSTAITSTVIRDNHWDSQRRRGQR